MDISITKVATAAAFNSVAAEIEAGRKVGFLTVFAAKGTNVFAYADEESPATQIGKVTGLNADELPTKGCYSVTLLSVDRSGAKPIIKARLDMEESAVAMATSTDAAGIEAQVQRIVTEGISDEADARQAIAVMEDNAVHPALIEYVLSTWTHCEHPHKVSLFYKNQRSKGEESFLTSAILAYKRTGLLLRGPKSTGKNVFAETLAYVLHIPYARINFTRDMLLEDVFGSKSTDNSSAEQLEIDLARAYLLVQTSPEKADVKDREKAAQFELLKAKSASVQIVHDVSIIIEWAITGGVLMLDEINMADANMLQQVVNPITDTERVLLVPGDGEIPLHPSCFVLGGMNPGYAGTAELNEATASRFGVLEFAYSGSISSSLQANFPDKKLTAKLLNACDTFYGRCMGLVSSGSITDKVLNVRGFVHALAAYLAFPQATSLYRQILIYVVGPCDEDERPQLTIALQDSIPDNAKF